MDKFSRAALAFVMYLTLGIIILAFGIGGSLQGWLLTAVFAAVYIFVRLLDRVLSSQAELA